MEKICEQCNKEFLPKRHTVGRFCSTACCYAWRSLGNGPKTKFKAGMTPWNKGIKGSTKPNAGSFQKGIIPWMKGKTHSLEVREQLRLSHLGKKLSSEQIAKIIVKTTGQKRTMETRLKMTGVNNPRWKGGITPERNKIRSSEEYKSWVQSVYARDNYTCAKTKQRGGKLVAHHILNFSLYPDLRFNIDNGITLSKESHELFHKIYGKHRNTKEQMIEFLSNYQLTN